MASKKNDSSRPATPAALDAATRGQPQSPAGDERLRQNLPPPVCPYHQVACKANHSDPCFTRYYCPEAGCSYSQKVPRPRLAQLVRRRDARDEDFSAR
jgi:hypothetical protein